MANGIMTDELTSQAIARHNAGKSRLIRSLDYGSEYIVRVQQTDFLVTEFTEYGQTIAERLDTMIQNG